MFLMDFCLNNQNRMNRIMIPMFPLQIPKRLKYHKKKDTPRNFLSPDCFSTLDFNNDVMIMEGISYDKDPGNYTKENTDER